MSEFYGMGHDGLNVALMSAFLDALGKRRAGELGDRAQALLNSVGRSDPRGAEKLEATLEGLVRELAPWIRGEAGKEKSESPLSIVDPEAPGGVRYELDAMSRSDESYAKNEAEEYERAKQRHEALLACASRLPVERAVLDAMPADCAFRQEQMFQVAILQHEVDGMRPGPPPPRTSAEARAGQLSRICRRRRGIDEEVAAAERDLADVAPRLRAFLTALDPANW